MKHILEKLKSRSGTSLLYALAVFVVATMVSAVILNSAVTANKRVHDDRSEEQSYLALSSTARLIAKQLENGDTETELQTLANSVAAIADKDTNDWIATCAPTDPAAISPSTSSACVIVEWKREYKEAPELIDKGPKIIQYLGTGTFGQQLANAVKTLEEHGTADPIPLGSALAFTGDGSDVFKDVEAKLDMRLSRMQPGADPAAAEKYSVTGVIQLTDESQKLHLSAYCPTVIVSAWNERPAITHTVYVSNGDPVNPGMIPEERDWYTDSYRVTVLHWKATLATNRKGAAG